MAGTPTDDLARDGFAVVAGAVDPALCARARTEVAAFRDANRARVADNLDDHDRLFRVVNLPAVLGTLADVFGTNRALAVCDEFFADEAVCYTSLFFGRGSQQDLHRDSPLFATRPAGRYLGVWVALEDTDADNGPLVAVPGSHALAPIDVGAIASALYGDPTRAPAADPAGWDTYQRAVQEQAAAAGLTARELHLRAGDVVVWHPELLHGGAVQRDPARTRDSIVFHVTPPNTPVSGQDVFYDPTGAAPERPVGSLVVRRGRRFVARAEVDFAHEFTRRVDELRVPGERAADRLRRGARAARRRLRS